jgi:hypothetical protein
LEFTVDPVPFVPSLVLGLRHNPNQVNPFIGPLRDDILRWQGGDIGAPAGSGYTWFSTPDEPGTDPGVWAQKIPPGVVLGLMHSLNQPAAGITAFGYSASNGPNSLPGFDRIHGGDIGAPAGEGFYWYESTGDGFSDWENIDEVLPWWAVVGLKHTVNQPGESAAEEAPLEWPGV